MTVQALNCHTLNAVGRTNLLVRVLVLTPKEAPRRLKHLLLISDCCCCCYGQLGAERCNMRKFCGTLRQYHLSTFLKFSIVGVALSPSYGRLAKLWSLFGSLLYSTAPNI